ncbi:MAG: bifunctional diaminohydroxyphosphoribosylaminopyrimidine deaminase/5-amino-6-(5-phosphoribosylamino)uracil reductase RibD, partial [Burkholderiaceae bacterium]|nr:bifunctional diaminohydroxyphosphoribosylaminopyrimidine deaminase/5-amino-6-(5-phosphoribosylamino)uracil reductase RibD [Burkholderiaceae bacterium]
MRLALALAHAVRTRTPPNPAVGCVLVDPQGRRLGAGATQPAGGAHAEIMALRDAASRALPVRGATAYVTLEPCSHQGRTGPCCDALIEAGIGKVVAAIGDPNPRVAGQGLARLRAAGIEVEIGSGGAASRELNIGFFSRMVRNMPWLRMKVAASLDGKTALNNGASQWITGAAARADGHQWRARAGAILTGVGTVLADDPRLDVRANPPMDTPVDAPADMPADAPPDSTGAAPRQPPLVIVDSRLRTPPTARLFETPGRAVWIYCAHPDAARAQALQARGASVRARPGAQDQVDLAAVLRDLAVREVNELHVEAGATLNGALIRAGLLDE